MILIILAAIFGLPSLFFMIFAGVLFYCRFRSDALPEAQLDDEILRNFRKEKRWPIIAAFAGGAAMLIGGACKFSAAIGGSVEQTVIGWFLIALTLGFAWGASYALYKTGKRSGNLDLMNTASLLFVCAFPVIPPLQWLLLWFGTMLAGAGP